MSSNNDLLNQPQYIQQRLTSSFKSLKLRALFVALLLSAVLAGTGGYLLGMRNNQSVHPSQSPKATAQSSVSAPSPSSQQAIATPTWKLYSNGKQSIDTSGWQTYRSENLGFEIKYPKHWAVAHEFIPTPPYDRRFPNTPLISIKSDSLAIIHIIPNGEYDYGLPHSIPRKDNIVINGHAAFRMEWILENGGRLVRVSFDDWNPYNRIELETLSQGDSKAQLEEMSKILSTFNLL